MSRGEAVREAFATDPTVRLLREAWAVIDDPTRWRKGTDATDVDDHPVDPDDPAACRWCASGALAKASGPLGRLDLHTRIQARAHANEALDACLEGEHADAVEYVTLSDVWVFISFNDHPETDHEGIGRLFARAIAHAVDRAIVRRRAGLD